MARTPRAPKEDEDRLELVWAALTNPRRTIDLVAFNEAFRVRLATVRPRSGSPLARDASGSAHRSTDLNPSGTNYPGNHPLGADSNAGLRAFAVLMHIARPIGVGRCGMQTRIRQPDEQRDAARDFMRFRQEQQRQEEQCVEKVAHIARAPSKRLQQHGEQDG